MAYTTSTSYLILDANYSLVGERPTLQEALDWADHVSQPEGVGPVAYVQQVTKVVQNG